jgi:hypothetical protein
MTFNIDGTTIHSGLSLPLNCKHLQFLSIERLNSFSKTYDDLQLVVLNEVSLIGSKIFSFIDLHLKFIKHTHNHLFGNMDVIIIGDLYQAPFVRNNWVFQRKFDNIDALAINLRLDYIHCFEFTQVMCQIDDQFIEVLNKFEIATHNPTDITLLNHTHLHPPPNDLNFPYMYYTNKSTKEKK